MERIEVQRLLPERARPLAQLFWDIEAWLAVWSAIEAVDVLYDDGDHQEFVMHVWRDGAEEVVRTLRFRDVRTGSISFFSPDPPPMMSRHEGEWLFEPVADETRVTATRSFELCRPPGVGPERADREFVDSFKLRLRAILDSFSVHCAGRGQTTGDARPRPVAS